MGRDLNKIKKKYGIVGKSEALDAALDIALNTARTECTVLVQGENGTGKEVFHKIIHDFSPRKNKPCIAVNCAALPEGTVDSALFGHVKGAFTDAIEDRPGFFSTCDGGTLFLDEIGELPLSTQARLLRVLETGEFIPVGASIPVKTDVRIVAATNVNLVEACNSKKFRKDLYYRLNVVRINVPPLRKRKEDIPLLFMNFALYFQEYYKLDEPIYLNDEAMRIFCDFSWPGNIRDLRHKVESMSITAPQREITPEILHNYLTDESSMLVKTNEEEIDYESDRTIIFKALFRLKQDIDKLAKQVAQLQAASGIKPEIYTEQNLLVDSGDNITEDTEYELIEETIKRK